MDLENQHNQNYNLTYNKIQKIKIMKSKYATNFHILCNYIIYFKENYF